MLEIGVHVGEFILPKMLHLETTKTVKSSMADLATSVNASSVRDPDWLFSSWVMEGSKTAQQTVNSLHQAVQHGKRIMLITGPPEIHGDIHNKRHCQTIGLASALMSSGRGRGSCTENTLKICQQFQHNHTHLELERKNNIIGNNNLRVQATT